LPLSPPSFRPVFSLFYHHSDAQNEHNHLRSRIYVGSRPTRVSHKEANITLPLNNPLQHPFQYHCNLSPTGTASPVHPPPQPPQSATPPLHIIRNVLVDSQIPTHKRCPAPLPSPVSSATLAVPAPSLIWVQLDRNRV
jgi:hypothetical protein